MRESVLSVTHGPNALRLLRLALGPGRPRVAGVAEAAPAQDDGPAGTAALAVRTAEAAGLAADQVILGLPAGAAVVRRLRFPFTAPSKIDLVLGPEFEPHLPTPLAESALAWTKTALEPAPAAVALAAAYPLADLTDTVAAFAAAGLPPRAACLDLAGLDAALGHLDQTGAMLLVSLDAGRADFACRLDGLPAVWRSLAAPGADDPALSAFLAREALLTLSAVALRPATPLRLFLAGEALPEAALAALAAALDAGPTVLADTPGWPTLPDGGPLPDRFAASYGLALLAAREPGTLNFLRGALAPAMAASVRRRGFLVAGLSVAALAVTAVLAVARAYWRLDAAIEASQARTAALVEQAVPDAAPGLTLTQKLSVLRGRLAEQDETVRNRAGGGTGSTLEVLAAIHQSLGQGGRVRVRRLAMDDRRVAIDATADDYNTVDEVKRRLAVMPLFADVEIKGAKNVPDRKQVEFQLDIRLAGAESGAGEATP